MPRSGAGASRTTSTTLAHLTERTFASVGLHWALQKSLDEVFQYGRMTKVQDQAIPVCMKGVDVVAKAKTGTGKTLAFLLPALNQVLSDRSKGPIKVLCMSPTRELAMQTAEESKSLLEFLPEHKTMTVLGGTNMNTEVSSFKRQAPLVLVATPGRLDDHLNNSGLEPLLANLSVLVFDEADQLLDMGFRPAIEKILTKLPPRERRQTLLFSATFPEQLQAVTRVALRKNHELVDCIGVQEEASNSQVEQYYSLCDLDTMFATTLAILDPLVRKPHKIMVFLPTARETGLFAAIFRELSLSGTEVLEIHSRKSQAQRTKISDQFRTMERGIMFSSDVSARGLDYPDVTFVLQVGAPSDRAQYLHRLGRTARAGKEGAGLLLLCDFEKFFLALLKDLPLEERAATRQADIDSAQSRVWRALPKVHASDPQIGAQAYQAWLGGRKSVIGKIRWSPEELVEWANYFATDVCGLSEVPALEAKTVGMMGLKGVAGLVVAGRGGGSKGGGGKSEGGKNGGTKPDAGGKKGGGKSDSGGGTKPDAGGKKGGGKSDTGKSRGGKTGSTAGGGGGGGDDGEKRGKGQSKGSNAGGKGRGRDAEGDRGSQGGGDESWGKSRGDGRGDDSWKRGGSGKNGDDDNWRRGGGSGGSRGGGDESWSRGGGGNSGSRGGDDDNWRRGGGNDGRRGGGDESWSRGGGGKSGSRGGGDDNWSRGGSSGNWGRSDESWSRGGESRRRDGYGTSGDSGGYSYSADVTYGAGYTGRTRSSANDSKGGKGAGIAARADRAQPPGGAAGGGGLSSRTGDAAWKPSYTGGAAWA